MFTGIIEEIGTVAGLKPSGQLTVDASLVLEGTRPGDSIAVAGVCLTVVEMTNSSFTVDIMPETLTRSTLGSMKPGTRVNLERALQPSGRLGGHMVNGHADGVGTVRSRRQAGNAVFFEIDVAPEVARYMVEKGSVAVDGISLTVVEAGPAGFSISIIPRTLEETTLAGARPGTRVNIEVDIIAKYVEAFLSRRSEGGGLSDALARGGFLEE